ncbi:MAG: hypothetical protein K940chlam9_00174 [Chlamydiae bacterium]|nr:hypothetical protein [Chlamydiota bacterium]
MGETLAENKVVLTARARDGEEYSVCFLPGKGMNFISFRKGDIEAIDQSTSPLFEERFAGLGALIGPHFHRRKPEVIPQVENESLFPHIARVKAKGVVEPFSHGIGRYAPWKVVSVTENTLKATLKGDDTWEGVSLKDLEGQNFEMEYEAKLTPEGLAISLAVSGETESVVGLHTYYDLAGGGSLKSRVQNEYRVEGNWEPIPSSWEYQPDHTLTYPVKNATDFGFRPFPDPLHGEILLQTLSHQVKVAYSCDNEENSFQVYHPEGASYVCIEPLSAQNPLKPKLTTNRLHILISIQ